MKELYIHSELSIAVYTHGDTMGVIQYSLVHESCMDTVFTSESCMGYTIDVTQSHPRAGRILANTRPSHQLCCMAILQQGSSQPVTNYKSPILKKNRRAFSANRATRDIYFSNFIPSGSSFLARSTPCD